MYGAWMVQVSSNIEDYVDDFTTWEDILIEFPDAPEDPHTGFEPLEFRDGDAEVTIYYVEVPDDNEYDSDDSNEDLESDFDDEDLETDEIIWN